MGWNEKFSPIFWKSGKSWEEEGVLVKKKNYKGKCEKSVPKCEGICKTYSALQSRMVDILSEDETVKDIRCNVLMEDIYTGGFFPF